MLDPRAPAHPRSEGRLLRDVGAEATGILGVPHPLCGVGEMNVSGWLEAQCQSKPCLTPVSPSQLGVYSWSVAMDCPDLGNYGLASLAGVLPEQ